MSKIKLFESHELGFFLSKDFLEGIFKVLIDWGYLSKLIYISEKPYKPSEYRTKFDSLDLDLTDEEMNSWVVDFDFELVTPPNLEESIIRDIRQKCESNGLNYFIERMPSGRYILTIMQFLPRFVQDLCDKIVEFDKSGFSSLYKNVRFFVKLSFSKSQEVILRVFFIGPIPKNKTDILIFSKFLEIELGKKLKYSVDIEFMNTEKTKYGECLVYNLPY